MSRRRKPVRPRPSLAALEARARIVTEQRRRAEVTQATRAHAATIEAAHNKLVVAAAEARHRFARAWLVPIADRLLWQARDDALLGVPDSAADIEWSAP